MELDSQTLCAFCWAKDAVLGKRRCVPFAAVWSQPGVVCSEKVTFDPLTFSKEPLKGNSKVHLHTPTKFGEDPSKDLGGVGEQINKQTDRQTNAARVIVWLLYSDLTVIHGQWDIYKGVNLKGNSSGINIVSKWHFSVHINCNWSDFPWFSNPTRKQEL